MVSLAFLAINCFDVHWTIWRIVGSIRWWNAFFTSTKQIDLIVSGKNVTYQINFLLTRYCFIYFESVHDTGSSWILVYVCFFFCWVFYVHMKSYWQNGWWDFIYSNSHLIVSLYQTFFFIHFSYNLHGWNTLYHCINIFSKIWFPEYHPYHTISFQQCNWFKAILFCIVVGGTDLVLGLFFFVSFGLFYEMILYI